MRTPDRRMVLKIQRSIFRWYRRHKRHLTWRSTTDPYKTLLSEIMLQQTQAARVTRKFPIFLRRFPTIRSLAQATRADVVRAWQGMGYNNRAVRLHEAARVIVEIYGGQIPDNISLLSELPGIGPYTAHAVTCFAFRRDVAVVDINIRRVLSRIFTKVSTYDHKGKAADIHLLATRILPRDAYTWNQALMDLGATICRARRPLCNHCPVNDSCKSSHLGSISNTGIRPRTKREPSHAGLPNRLWRGRIVQNLRLLDDHKVVTIMKLGKSIKNNFRREEMRWLKGILRSLSEDGIVTTERAGSGTVVRLADE